MHIRVVFTLGEGDFFYALGQGSGEGVHIANEKIWLDSRGFCVVVATVRGDNKVLFANAFGQGKIPRAYDNTLFH